jgi:hypothetical protein
MKFKKLEKCKCAGRCLEVGLFAFVMVVRLSACPVASGFKVIGAGIVWLNY